MPENTIPKPATVMPFSISKMIVDSDQNIVALDWAYTNPDGTLSSQHRLLKPYGGALLDAVTEELAITWLTEQLKHTSEDFDAEIAQRKAQSDYAQTLVDYKPHAGAPPTRMTQPMTETPEVVPPEVE